MYYMVLVASQTYHKVAPLTYRSDSVLLPGTVVLVPLQHRVVPAIIISDVAKPKFLVKPVKDVIDGAILPETHLELIKWLKAYYPAPSGLIHSLFTPNYLASVRTRPGQTNTKVGPPTHGVLPALTDKQARVVKQFETMSGHCAYLYGVTGSGKTRVYLELAQLTLKKQRSVIILTPEIGLTPQLMNSIQQLAAPVTMLHSHMSVKERRAAWLYLASAKGPQVVIGPRSALFAPTQNIGLIVIDEAHDQAYKQEQAPYYLTARVAAKLAAIAGAKLLLGSATPTVSDYTLFKEAGLPILRLDSVAIPSTHSVNTEVVDLRDDSQFQRSRQLSEPLLKAIDTAAINGEQSLLFLNRRGTARIIACQVCGWNAICPRCDLPITYHGDTHKATCHTCGYSQPTPTNCAQCDSTDILFRSPGTKSVVAELERLYPKLRVQRFDSDAKKDDRLEQQFADIAAGKVDIIVGTQILGKGLDLPKLAVVGVVLADTALNFPDYTAEERSFQLLTQVVGRVGRGHRPGTVIVQSYHPDSSVIQQALTANYAAFYNSQVKERQQFNFPPFCHLLKLTCRRKSQSSAMQSSSNLARELGANVSNIEVIGPSPAFTEKSRGSYTWQIIIKAPQRKALLQVIKVLPANWLYDLDPVHLL